METENRSTNPRQPGSASLPAITLVVLIGMIAALLYVGFEYISDDTHGSDELTNVAIDTLSQQPLAQEDPDMLMAPDDTSSQPAPVDLSQASPPADAAEANVPAEQVAEGNRETTDGKPAASERVADVERAAPVRKEELMKKAEPKEPKKEAPKEKPVVAEKPTVKPGGVTTSHTVGAGETFYGVANRYNMKVSTLKALNPNVSESDVKAGVTRLNVKTMTVHTVGPGDVLRVVAQKYGVSKEAIMRANHKDKDIATRGEKLIIPYPDKQ
jgi:LysM repeat protein